MITIVDYGLGNVRAFLNVYKRLQIPATTAATAEELSTATKVILPGVGHFDHAMQRLEESGMRQVLDQRALEAKVPVLGVCVGMQMLGGSSEEGVLPGLGWIDGTVRAFPAVAEERPLAVPHMGWNDVRPEGESPLFHTLEQSARFYFLHSFYFECSRPEDIAARSQYGGEFACAVRSGNLYGVQFHPEKSHHYGTQLLRNFALQC